MSDIILISKVGLYETIKCTICKNPNQTERGCDGYCQYDKELHAKIVEAVIGIAEQRPHGEWVKGREISRTMLCDKTLHIDYENFSCSVCGLVLDRLLYNVDGSPFYKFCPNCGASMSANDRQVTGKLNSETQKSNSEIEKSKSEIVPDYRDGWKLKGSDDE